MHPSDGQDKTPQRRLGGTTALGLLLLIAGAGCLLRFYGIGDQSLWNDELFSWSSSNYTALRDAIKKGAYYDVHPPGYPVLLFFVQKWMGDSETLLRLPSAVAGALSIPVIYLLGLRLYGYRQGLIAAALTAFSWCPVYYSQEARVYSLLYLFSMLSTLLWILLLEEAKQGFSRRCHGTAAGYAVSAVIVSYLHYFGLLLIGLQAAGALFSVAFRQKARSYMAVVYCVIAVAYSPWWPAFWRHLNKGPIWIAPPSLDAFYGYLRFCFNDSDIILLIILPVYVFYGVRAIVGISANKSWPDQARVSNPTFLILLWAVAPFAVAFIKSTLSAPVLTNRNLIISLPAVYLLLARAITELPLKRTAQGVAAVSIAGLLVTHLVFVKHYYWSPQKEQFRQAVDFIVDYDQRIQPEALTIGWAWGPEYFDYYLKKRNADISIAAMAGQAADIPMVADLIRDARPRYLWLISGHRIPEEKFLRFLKTSYTLMESKQFFGTHVWLFRVPT